MKFKKLNSFFIYNVVGNGKREVVKPFGTDQSGLHCKQMVHLYVGWFGKANKDLVVVLEAPVKQAVADKFGLAIITCQHGLVGQLLSGHVIDWSCKCLWKRDT